MPGMKCVPAGFPRNPAGLSTRRSLMPPFCFFSLRRSSGLAFRYFGLRALQFMVQPSLQKQALCADRIWEHLEGETGPDDRWEDQGPRQWVCDEI